MIKRNKLGQFVKGIHPATEFKKGQHHSPKTEFKKGNKSWNKGTRGVMIAWNKGLKVQSNTGRTHFKKGDNTGKENYMWIGDKIGYKKLHDWVYYHKGKPKICEHCGLVPEICKCCGSIKKGTKLEWANKDHSYKRDINDYISLCRSCHKKYDIKNNKGKRKK